MSNKSLLLPDYVLDYVCNDITHETPVQKRLRAETSQLRQSVMQTTADQMAFLSLLVKAMGAKNLIEVGTFTGYSALSLASALPKDGKLIACDVSTVWTDTAMRYWTQAGVADRIDLRIAPAERTLNALIDENYGGTFDFIFIDADKTAYDTYYEKSLILLRQGGVIAFDNMLWGGSVADSSDNETETVALRNLNAKISKNTRVDAALLTIADGIMLARKH